MIEADVKPQIDYREFGQSVAPLYIFFAAAIAAEISLNKIVCLMGELMTKSLDLGCSIKPKNPYHADEIYGVDIWEDLSRNIKKADLVVEPIPFEDDFFDFVTAYDLIEHIPRLIYKPERRLPFIELMNEIYRVLKMGGFFFSQTPAFPNAAAFVDPTHVNFITEGTFPLYFCDSQSNPPWGGLYGFRGVFSLRQQEWSGPQLLTLMQKIPVKGRE